jgi:phage FluMu protein Com
LPITFKCPKCDADNKFSLADSAYNGPYRCWKCGELFMISIAGNELKSCEPITEEEMNRQKEIEALKAKFKKR